MDGSPISKILMSPLNLTLSFKTLLFPPNNNVAIAFLISSCPYIAGPIESNILVRQSGCLLKYKNLSVSDVDIVGIILLYLLSILIPIALIKLDFTARSLPFRAFPTVPLWPFT